MNTDTQTKAQLPQEQPLFIERIFDARREEVWRAWTEPTQVMRWWGGESVSSPFATIDLRLGGKYLFDMRLPDGQEVWGTGEYREIVPLEKIVFTDSFADEHGHVVPATFYGMDANFPNELLVTVTFNDAGQGKTHITLRHDGIPAGEDLEMIKAGWEGSFDKLASFLKTLH